MDNVVTDSPPTTPAGVEAMPAARVLRLTDFLETSTLQDIQDAFAAALGVQAVITDAGGAVLTQANPTTSFLTRSKAIADAQEQVPEPQRRGQQYVAPIVVGRQTLGEIRMKIAQRPGTVDEAKLGRLARKYGIEPAVVQQIATDYARDRTAAPAAVQLLFMLANTIARLCYQDYQLRQRLHDITAIKEVTSVLAEARDLKSLLDRTAKLIAQLMQVKAASIRLIDELADELTTMAAYNLSPQYMAKGRLRFSESRIDQAALGPRGFEIVSDVSLDSRVIYPDFATREGIVSIIAVGMRFRDEPVGVIRLYTSEPASLSPQQIDLLLAIASTAAASIENARLAEENREAEFLERQVQTAGDVQQRMIPQTMPKLNGAEIAAAYEPCFDLGGDLYDVIELPYDNVGVVVADVSGKGVPASLIMASVRATLRASVDNIYSIDEVVRRVNLMLCRDTRDSEFVTLFYGVFDLRNKRLTYVNAGHNPGLLQRGGKLIELGAGDFGSPLLGVDPDAIFEQHYVQLQSDDRLLLYTDGLNEARNFDDEMYGTQRVLDSFSRPADTAEQLANNVLWDLRRFVGLAKPTDDITIVTARIA